MHSERHPKQQKKPAITARRIAGFPELIHRCQRTNSRAQATPSIIIHTGPPTPAQQNLLDA